MDFSDIAERLLRKPLWVIDPMPARVDKAHGERFFALEAYWRQGDGAEALFAKFLRVLQKLNCYYSFTVICDGDWDAPPLDDPDPETLERLVTERARSERGRLDLLLDGGKALLTLSGDEVTLGVYGPDERLRGFCKVLAASEGLFWWPSQQEESPFSAPSPIERVLGLFGVKSAKGNAAAGKDISPAPPASPAAPSLKKERHETATSAPAFARPLLWGSAAALLLCILIPLGLRLGGLPVGEKLLHTCAGLGFCALLAFFYARALLHPRE